MPINVNCSKRFDNETEITKNTNITKNKYNKKTHSLYYVLKLYKERICEEFVVHKEDSCRT